MPAALTAALIGAGVIGGALAQLDIHSPAEIVVGAVLGIAGAAGFVSFAGATLERRFDLRPLVLIAAVAAGLHGLRLPAEDVIRVEAAGLIQTSVSSCAQAVADPAPSS